ncbi:putative alpha crystallin/Hsp20 domain, HSP20-like chaperone [Helianthus debilis subsp. tardiflorus]
MAMRGRGGGRGGPNPNRPPRVNRVYEQFKPMSEWRQEDGYDTLLVYLPGFQKEYIKVATEELNIVRVRGERLVAENKWSRFQEDYRVPENCEMRGIRAKFDGGILTITMPRKIINAPPPPPPTVTTTARVAPKTVERPQKPKEEPTEKKPDKHQTRRLEDNTLPPPPKPTSSSAPIIERPQKPNAEPKETKTSHLEDHTLPPPPKPTSSLAPTKQPPSKLAPEAKDVVRDRFEHDVIEKPVVSEKTNLAEGKGKETMLKEETKRDIEGSKGKPNNSGVVSGGLQGIVARRGIKEDRKLLVNVGVGVLMIVALGVHVSYTMGLIGKGG